jgi:hypothetical protein
MVIAVPKPVGGFLAAVALAALPAAAAPAPTRTAIPPWERPVPKGEDMAVRALRTYSACLALAPDAPRLLRMTPGTSEEAAALHALVRGRKQCRLKGQLSVRAYMLRGAIAEVLYSAAAAGRSNILSPASPAETFSAFIARLTAAARDGREPIDARIRAWRWMAYCAAHGDPYAAEALLRSKPSDPAEVAALQALRPALEACLRQEDWAELRAVTIRALIAEALFRRLPVAA